jgi:pimeloyl-ACP methyl ester carboxylesterase
MPLAEVADIQLDYERSGSGEPLLLIMGMSGTALHWGEPFLAELRREFEVIVFDHRGVGASTQLHGPVTIAQMAEDASGLLSAIGIDSAHVLGISMGGMIAQELALAHPGQIRTLTLGCTYCGGEGSALAAPEVMQRLGAAMMSGDRQLALRVAWEINVSAQFAADADAYARFLAISEQRAVAVPVVMAQLQACTAHDTRERLAGLQTDTLVIHGSADQLLPALNGRLIASLIPGAELEMLEDIGHLFFWERPQYAAELIINHSAVHA